MSITLLHLLLHEKVVEFHLADEASMFTSAVQWSETLQDAVDDERVVLVADGDQIAMALCIACLIG